MELALSERVRPGLPLRNRCRDVHDLGDGCDPGDLSAVPDRGAHGLVSRRAHERAGLLPGGAGRAELHPVGPPQRRRPPERPGRDDLSDTEREQLRRVQGRSLAARRPDRCLGRLVGRGRLPQVRPDDELHGRPPPDRDPRSLGADGIVVPIGLHRRGEVRRRLATPDVGRPDTHPLLPGRHRRGEREHSGRPRHLAPSPGRRHVRRMHTGLSLHLRSSGLPSGSPRLADQPEPRRP